jgi:hypothetical protein
LRRLTSSALKYGGWLGFVFASFPFSTFEKQRIQKTSLSKRGQEPHHFLVARFFLKAAHYRAQIIELRPQIEHHGNFDIPVRAARCARCRSSSYERINL